MADRESTPLAIIGIGCLFPGSRDAAGYWSRIVTRHDSVTEVPASHWRAADYLDADPKAADRVYAARGAFLEPVDFAPQAFGLAPNNLEATDTSQLLGMVVAQQALTDSGYTVAGAEPPGGPKLRPVPRERVSVILGVTGTLELVIPLGARLGHPIWRRALAEAGVEGAVAEDVVARIADAYVPWQENSFPGLLGNVVAGRVANRLDLGGTNCVVDAACASSLSAVHLAALELQAGVSDLVLTGGVDTFNDIFMFTCFSKTPALSPTGDARPFDAGADGTVLGEGIGMVVLKRLDDARRDGDKVYAVPRGLGSSSDGRGNAIYAPKASGQVDAIRAAYRAAGVTPDTIELVEAHGTGTKVGDATEVSGLVEVYGSAAGGRRRWCALGSVKSQIGHTKAAAGAAGLIKAALALHHKVLPPTIKVRQPGDGLTAESPFYVNTERRPWVPSAHPRRAAVSAFGFGGSNFHLVLEEADPVKDEIDWDGTVEILAFSGEDAAAVRRQVQAFPPSPKWDELGALAARSRREWRGVAACRLLIVVERDRTDLAAALSAAAEALASGDAARLPDGVFLGTGPAAGKLAVLFPGQGAQYVGMARDLACHFPPALAALADANAAAGSRVSDAIYPPPAFTKDERAAKEADLRRTEVTQPALGAVELGAWRVLESFGVRVDAFAGHSYGELVALCAAGRISDGALHALSALRGRLMAGCGGSGGMLAVKATADEVAELLRAEGIDLVMANKNAPRQTVLSGDVGMIDRAVASFGGRKVSVVRLDVGAAFHSPLVAAAAGPFGEALAGVELLPCTATVYANTTAAPYPDDAGAARALLAGQLARPVEWVAEVEALHAAGVRTFLEVGPGARLTGLLAQILAGRDHRARALDASSGVRSGFFDLACGLAWLAARGHHVDLGRWAPRPDAGAEKPARATLTVPICGANYVKPRERRPAAPARPPTRVEPAARPAAVVSSPPGPATPKMNGSTPAREPAPKSGAVASSPVAAPAPADGSALTQALLMTRESMAALQRMQEQTAGLHRQYLEGQDSAQRTVALLVDQQQRLLHLSLGFPGAAVAAPVPPALMAPAPVPVPVPVPQPRLAPPVAPPAVVASVRASAVVVAPPLQKSAPQPPAPAVQVPGSAVERTLLEVIAEKTGYPPEMLELDMALDADLGIDSIKRVEILSALQERLPEAPAVKPEHLGTLHTLRHIAAFLAEGSPSAPAPSAPAARPAAAPGLGQEQVQEALLGVIAEKTGYPPEMLELDMALDADLGIDSIKRVEILSALQERLPEAPAVKPEHLGTLHTLRHIAAFLAGGAGPSAPAVAPPAPGVNGNGVGPAVLSATPPAKPPPEGARLERSVLELVTLAPGGLPGVTAPAGAEVWLTDDDAALADVLEARLGAMGLRPRRAACAALASLDLPPALGGLFVIAGPGAVADAFLSDALRALRHAGPALRAGHGVFATVSRLDGAFGLAGIAPGREPVDGGLAGLSKTAGHEWSGLTCKALDLSPEFASADDAGRALAEELFRVGPVEVGLSPAGRVALQRVTAAQEPGGTDPLAPGDVVVVSGGARGVTAEVAVALARAFRPTLVLLGRSPEPSPEPDWLVGLTAEADVKRELARRSAGASPREVGERSRQLLANREVTATLERIQEAGATALYRSADVRDEAGVAAVVEAVRREYGPVRGVVHGAGVLADARIEDKTDEQFDRVYGTKVGGLRALLRAAGADDLRALVVFSSSTARFGRSGQVDYAVANEVLNKVAQAEARARPACRVLSLNWGPWDGGMVTPGLADLFAREGVGLIPLTSGAEFLVGELRSPARDVEVVVLAGGRHATAGRPAGRAAGPALPPALPTAFERVLDLVEFPILAAHVFDGRPVVPMALILEWLAHAALHQNPGLKFHGCDEFRVLHGVALDGGTSPVVRVGAGKAGRRDGFFVAPVELRGVRPDGREVLHARAEVILAADLPAPPPPRDLAGLAPARLQPGEAYETGALFHGPDLRGLEAVDGCDDRGISGRVRSAPAPAAWLRQPMRQRWLTDPLAIDGSFQLLILWALERRGAASLPCYGRRYRQYRAAFPAGGVRLLAEVTRATDAHALADIDFIDDGGGLVARLEGYECVIDPALERAFRKNTIPAGT